MGSPGLSEPDESFMVSVVSRRDLTSFIWSPEVLSALVK